MSQDWELPINGFMVIAPKRHIENLSELSDIERNEIFDLVNKTITLLKQEKVCDAFNVVFEEKKGIHFHIWIMPRHAWMKEKCGSAISNIGNFFEYAKTNLKTKQNLQEIAKTCEKLKAKLNK